MAKRQHNSLKEEDGGVAVAPKEPRMAESVGPVPRPGPGGGGSEAPRRSFFDIYKPGQGYYTRVWSGIVYGALVCWGAYNLFEKLDLLNNKSIQVFIPVAAIIGLGLLGYWVLALNRKVCDFMIATEGEMKKVNWTSRKEIIGSTKVVIFVVVILSLMLFIVDLFFMTFFGWIGVLKGTSLVDVLREIF